MSPAPSRPVPRLRNLKWLRALPLMGLIVCVIWYFRTNVSTMILDGRPSDFSTYYQAALHLLGGRSPFLSDGYLYPPLLAFLISPLALLDYVTARRVWFLLSHISLLAAAWVTWRCTARQGTPNEADTETDTGADLNSGLIRACIVGFVWAAGGAAGENLALGQVGPALTLLIALVLANAAGGPRARVAILVGCGLALKILPGALSFLLILQRRWRALMILTLAAALLFAVPWAVVARLPGPKAPPRVDFLAGTPAVLSWSLPSAVLRLLDPPSSVPGASLPATWLSGQNLQTLRLEPRSILISGLVSIYTLVTGLLILFTAVRKGTDRGSNHPFASRLRDGITDSAGGHCATPLSQEQSALAGAALIALVVAASPVAWTHYQVMQYPGVALLLCHALRLRRWKLLGASLVFAALLYPVPVAVLRFYFIQNHGWPNLPLVMYFWTTVSPIASLCLFTLMARELRISQGLSDRMLRS